MNEGKNIYKKSIMELLTNSNKKVTRHIIF